MPVLSKGNLRIDYTDDGRGPPVVLIHSSVSANRQWRALTDALKDRYRILAINLFGYGETTRWTRPPSQSLQAQAELVVGLCDALAAPVHLVGHSFGGSVAAKAATLLDARAASLVLLEPNPFYLLSQGGRAEAFLEAHTLRDHVKHFGAHGDWSRVGELFADYWLGDGAWDGMSEKRRAAFAEALPPNFHEWDAVMDEASTIEEWKALKIPALVVSDPATRRPIREIVELLGRACPHWQYVAIPGGGHMAPLTHPELVNPVVRAFLDRNAA